MASVGLSQNDSDLCITRGSSSLPDPADAVAELWDRVQQPNPVGAVIFCSPRYNLEEIANTLNAKFPCKVFGCTTAGEINENGYVDSTISGVCFGGDIVLDVFDIDLLDHLNIVTSVTNQVNRVLVEAYDRHSFGFLLVDGLSCAEEHLAASIYQGIGHIPLIGGSAGDDYRMERTSVFVDGRFLSGHAVFACFSTVNRIMAIKFDHFHSTDHLMLVTGADPAKRIVYEFNMQPATKVYAQMLGIEVADLERKIGAEHPFVLDIAGYPYLRSIKSINPDGSISLFCGIEEGLVVSVAEGSDPLEAARHAFARVRQHLGEVAVTLACDCAHRRTEYMHRGILSEMGSLLSEFHATGLNTYGEQFNAVHINQTFTGVSIAA